ncbi:MAG: hypothetical protein KJ624_02095 [Chloroflexi bacterium]|nr:hypothetical protein [Chloroflexota bacterium]
MENNKEPSWFGGDAHRWPPEALAMAYAMACVEIVRSNSERAGAIYRDILDAWGKPDVKSFYDALMSEVSDSEKEEWKDKVRFPESGFEGDVNRPWTDLLRLVDEPDFEKGIVEGKWKAALESLEGEYRDAADLFGLILEFILVGFNREQDVAKGKYKVIPTANPPWLVLAVMYRTAFEHREMTLDRLRRIYKVRKFKGKTYDFEEVLHKQPMSRMHRRMVAAGKKAKMVLRHDRKFLDAARLWYQCRVVNSGIEGFLNSEAEKGNDTLDLKNTQKKVRACDDAVGYERRGKKPLG